MHSTQMCEYSQELLFRKEDSITICLKRKLFGGAAVSVLSLCSVIHVCNQHTSQDWLLSIKYIRKESFEQLHQVTTTMNAIVFGI